MAEIGNNTSLPTNFIRELILKDLENGRFKTANTRFPPEPNGYLHIGHAKALFIDYSMAREFGGFFNLRFDDTNPSKEDVEFVDGIIDDIKWLGLNFDNVFYGSDYFEKIYEYAIEMIKKGKAYVDDLSQEEIREYRGTLTVPGKNSPYRERTVEENLELFEKMRAGCFKDGEKVLRAKIDMASPNLNMRDPVMYRIKHERHHHTGDKWCIYPMYDWAHGLQDSIEGITYSLCSLEYENHRPLYDWFLDQLDGVHHPQQIEFARLNLSHTVMSKRKLRTLVEGNYVDGWDDPRMPTLVGMRRRGYTPEAIKNFLLKIGVSKVYSIVDIALLEHCLREEMNKKAKRVMAVLRPLKVVIENYPEGQTDWLDAENNPEDPEAGTRKIPFSKEIFIEKDDFRIDPPKGYFRLSPGREVRLKHAYYVTCVDYKVDEGTGEVTEVICRYDPNSKGGWSEDGRKVKGTLHWVSAEHAVDAEVRLYDRLFLKEDPEDDGDDFIQNINPNSLEVLKNCKVEPSLKDASFEDKFQFLRTGYFCLDNKNSSKEHLVFNRSVALKESKIK